jgi:hypothetical protein
MYDHINCFLPDIRALSVVELVDVRLYRSVCSLRFQLETGALLNVRFDTMRGVRTESYGICFTLRGPVICICRLFAHSQTIDHWFVKTRHKHSRKVVIICA